jgi:thioredoxin 1
MGAHTVEVSQDNFRTEIAESTLPVVVDFWAPWCGPCRSVAPVLDRLATQYEGKVKVAKINVDENQQIAGAFKIRGIPTLLVVQGGQVTEEIVGFNGAKPLEALFQRLASAAAA